LKLYASLVEESVAEERLMEAKGSLYDRADELMSASSRMVEALEQLTPQLEIHQYDLYQQIVYYKETRCWEAGIGEELDYAMFDAEHGKLDDLNRILSQEEQSYRQIDQCLRDFRIFIIKEIPFGQSF
jgi:hypothetical protein